MQKINMDVVSKPNVLLVDDNPVDLKLLDEIFKDLDVRIIKANSGKQALSKIKEVDLALALLDIQMPLMNGIELAKLIREEEKSQTIPIIFLTAYYDSDLHFIEGYKAGAVDYMLKPINSSILLSKVNVFLNLDKQRNLLIRSKHKLQESEKKYRTLVEQSLQGIVVTTGLQIVFANGSFANMTGYTVEELKGLAEEQVASVINPELLCSPYPGHAGHSPFNEKRTGRFLGEYKGYRKDGSMYWSQVSVNPIQYGKKTASQITVIDITERKLAEEALVESEKMYRTLLDASPEGILIIDPSGRITEVSSITPEIFGAENKHDLIGKHFMRFIHKESREKVRQVIERTMSEGLEQDTEFILTKPGQKQFVGEVSTTLIQESNGMPQSFMAIIRDISQRKEMEKQLIHTERMAGLGEMATGIAHEINQPLNTISISLENMLHKIPGDNNNGNRYLSDKISKIFESIYRIGKIIDHIRAFSRDNDDYIPTAFDINESIRNALSLITVQYKHKAIDLVTDLGENLPSVTGNTFKFEQVVLNLVINAKDALENQQTEEKEIRISTFRDGQNIFIEVSDNGTGIKKEDIGNIMLPFYSTKEEGKGTGMGLAISFGIIKEMKGNIDIQSEVLKGTTIRITLPVGKI